MKTFSEIQELLEKKISNIEFPSHPKNLYDPVKYILALGGKRIRPALTLMACNLFSGNIQPAINPAIGLEVFHNFTLLHDDIMDKSPLRRGKQTVHEKWNENVAILSGDTMQIIAYKFISQSPKSVLTNVLDCFNQTAIEVCEGQQLDMDFETRTDVTILEYMKMIELKTSVLLAACLKIGAIIGQASNQDAENLYQFGKNLGLAFQIQDDWLDTFGNPELFKKKLGNDIVTNKKTFLLISALSNANPKTKVRLMDILYQKDCIPEQKVSEVTEIFKSLNISDLTTRKIQEFTNTAFSFLYDVQVHNDRKEQLLNLSKQLMNRSF